jgi:hypothetical protein
MRATLLAILGALIVLVSAASLLLFSGGHTLGRVLVGALVFGLAAVAGVVFKTAR